MRRSSHQSRTCSRRLICNPEIAFASTQTLTPSSLWSELLLLTPATVATGNYFVDCVPTQTQKNGLLLPLVRLLSAAPRKSKQVVRYNELYVFGGLARRRARAHGEWASACSDYLLRPYPPLIRQEFPGFSVPRYYYFYLAHTSNAPRPVYRLHRTGVFR
jgi:hypothetical protein